MIVHNNLPILEELNQIHQAKDNVYIARGNLLPSLNLGALLNLTGGPAFALSSISVLLPFLVPANWANLHQSEDLLESEKLSFRILELNNYATAYTLYETMLSDQAVRETLVQQYNADTYIHDWIVQQHALNGKTTQGDIDNADAQMKLAQNNIAATDQALANERATLANMLVLPNDNFTLANVHIPASQAETQSLNTVVNKIQSVAPENAQMNYMIKAAQEVQWSKVFAFFGGAGLDVAGTSGGGGGKSSPFGHVQDLTGQFTLSFAQIPTVQLASDQVANLEIQKKALLAGQLQLGQTSLGSVTQAKIQVDTTQKAYTELVSVAQEYFLKYTLSLTDLTNVFQQVAQAAQAQALNVKAQLDIDSLRVTLHRELLTDQFASIPGCKIRPEAEQQDKNNSGLFGGIGDLLHPGQANMTIDQACMPAN
jgi:outer membrane protein TolC